MTTVGRSLHDLLGPLLHVLKNLLTLLPTHEVENLPCVIGLCGCFLCPGHKRRKLSVLQICPPRWWLAYSFTFSTASLESASLSLLTWLCRSPGFWLPASCLTSLSSCPIPVSSSQHSGLHGSSSRHWQGSSWVQPCHPVPSLKLSIRKTKGLGPSKSFHELSLAYFWVFSECVEKAGEGFLLGPQEL